MTLKREKPALELVIPKPGMEWIPLGSLMIDRRVQRELDMKRVESMAAEPDLDALGVLCVSRRSNGKVHIIDGQHRSEVLKLLGFKDDVVLCEVFENLTLEQEAAMFRIRNNTKKPTPVERFLVRVVEGEANAVAITKLARRYGWKIGQHSNLPRTIACVSSLETIFRMSPEGAEDALRIITSAWNYAPNSMDGHLFQGIGMVCARHGPNIDHDDMITKLAKQGTALSLIGKGRSLRAVVPVSLPNAIADIVVEIYNKSKRTLSLPPWRTTPRSRED